MEKTKLLYDFYTGIFPLISAQQETPSSVSEWARAILNDPEQFDQVVTDALCTFWASRDEVKSAFEQIAKGE